MKTDGKINKRIEIPSNLGYIKKTSQEILKHLERMNIDESIRFDIRLSVEEAVRNAIEHGHNYDRNLPIEISYEIDKEKIEVAVKDRGKGFDFKKVPDPRKENNILKEGGRGVFLIYKLMDKVRYNKAGNAITMVKYLHGNSVKSQDTRTHDTK